MYFLRFLPFFGLAPSLLEGGGSFRPSAGAGGAGVYEVAVLTFESMISLDPTMGGFTAGAGGVSGFGAGSAGAGQSAAATGQFAAELSGVMSGSASVDEAAAAVSGASEAQAPANAAVSVANMGVFGVPGLIPTDIDVGVKTESSEPGDLSASVSDAAATLADSLGDLAGAPTDGEAGDGASEAPDDGTAALKAGMAVAPGMIAALDGAPSTAGAGAQAAAGAAAAGLSPGGEAAGDNIDQSLPTFFPQKAGAASAGDAAQANGDIDLSAQKPAASSDEAMAKAAAALKALTDGQAAGSAVGDASGTTGDSAGFATTTGAAKVAASAGGIAAEANAKTAQTAQSAAISSEKTQNGTSSAPAQTAAKATSSAATSGLAEAIDGDGAGDDAIISIKAVRADPSTAADTPPGGKGDDTAMTRPAASQGAARVQAVDPERAEASDGIDPATAETVKETKKSQAAASSGTASRTVDQAVSLGLKEAAGGTQAGRDGDPRLVNLSSTSEVSAEGEASADAETLNQKMDAAGVSKQAARAKAHMSAGSASQAAGAAAVFSDTGADDASQDGLDPLTLGATVDAGSSTARGTDGQAVRMVQAGQGTTAALPTAMVAAEIARNVQRGVSKFEIRLDPPELGRVDVHLKISDDGKVQAHLVVERRDTLDMFMRDQRGMERALENAGLKTNADGGLQFSLKDQGQGQRFGNGDGDQNGAGAQTGTPAGGPAGNEAADQPQMLERIAAYSRRGAGGVDIRI